MNRITNRDLELMVNQLNAITDSPLETYSRNQENTRSIANVGNFHISSAYGGVALHRISNPSGSVSTPLGLGHVTKRELYDSMSAFLAGIESWF